MTDKQQLENPDVLVDLHGLPAILPTKQAAQVINREAQTMRKWACLNCGPIKPIRINRRLHWRLSDLKKLLAGGHYE